MPLPTPRSANVPDDAVVAGVTQLADAYDIRRPTNPADDQYGTSREYASVGTRQLYLYVEDVQVSDTAAGETTERRLAGYAAVDTDVQADDRVDYGSDTYEFDGPVPRPSDDPTVLELTATRV